MVKLLRGGTNLIKGVIMFYKSSIFAGLLLVISSTGCAPEAEPDPQVTAPAAVAQNDMPTANAAAETPSSFDSMPAPGTKAWCPVMQREFIVSADSPFSVYKGKTVVFCCAGCKPEFDKNPEQYLK